MMHNFVAKGKKSFLVWSFFCKNEKSKVPTESTKLIHSPAHQNIATFVEKSEMQGEKTFY